MSRGVRKLTTKLILHQLSHAEMRALALTLGLAGHESLTMTKPVLCKFVIGKSPEFMYLDFDSMEISTSSAASAKFRDSRKLYLSDLARFMRKEIDEAPELSSDLDEEEDLTLNKYDKSDDLDIDELTMEEEEEDGVEESDDEADASDEDGGESSSGRAPKEVNDNLRKQFQAILQAQTGKATSTATETVKPETSKIGTSKPATTQMSLLGNKKAASPASDSTKHGVGEVSRELSELTNRVTRLESLMINNQAALMAILIQLNAGDMNDGTPEKKLVFPKLLGHEALRMVRTKINAAAKQLYRLATETDVGESSIFPVSMAELPMLTAKGWENGQPKDPFTGED